MKREYSMPIIAITLHKMKMVNENESTLQQKDLQQYCKIFRDPLVTSHLFIKCHKLIHYKNKNRGFDFNFMFC